MARLFNPFHYLPAANCDLRNTLKGFESFSDVDGRRKAIVKFLNKGNRADRRLARKLKRCKKGRRCLSGACPICRRRMRMWFVGEVYDVFEHLADEQVILLTIICSKQQFSANDLGALIPRNAVNRLTTKLRRLGFENEVMLGALDYDWCVRDNECAEGYWQVHYHLICPRLSETQVDALREVFPNNTTAYVHKAVVPSPIKNRPEQFSYVLKPFFQKRSSYISSNGRRNAKKGPINNARRRRELFHQLDRHPMTESLVLFHARRIGGDIRPTVPVVDDNWPFVSTEAAE